VRSPSRKITERRDRDLPFYLIERSIYDQYLLKMAVEAGCELVEAEAVTGLDPMHMEVETTTGRRFRGKFIIGADGVNSRVRRRFPVDIFGRDEWAPHLAPAHQITVPIEMLDPPPQVPTLYFGLLNHGYGWVFPGTDTAKIGVAGLKRQNRQSIIEIFRVFLSHLGIGGDVKIHSWPVPYGAYLPEPAFRNILLVGDAAGFADPLMGEGIYYAQQSGKLAAESIIECKNGGDVEGMYCRKIRRDILPEMRYAEKIRKVLFSLFRMASWYPLSITMGLFGKTPLETIHGMRSYRYFKRRKE